MKKFPQIFAGLRPNRRHFSPFRLMLGLFVAFLLPLSQAANFVHIIAGQHESHSHGHSHPAHGHHHDVEHSSSAHDDHTSEKSHHSQDDHGPESDHHTATDHLQDFHVWKPTSKVFNPAMVAVLATHVLAIIEIPRDVTWPRDEQQRLLVRLSGPPPQLRAPPAHS